MKRQPNIFQFFVAPPAGVTRKSEMKLVLMLANSEPGTYQFHFTGCGSSYSFIWHNDGNDLYVQANKEFLDGCYNIMWQEVSIRGQSVAYRSIRREHATSILALYNLTKKLIGYRDDRPDLD